MLSLSWRLALRRRISQLLQGIQPKSIIHKKTCLDSFKQRDTFVQRSLEQLCELPNCKVRTAPIDIASQYDNDSA